MRRKLHGCQAADRRLPVEGRRGNRQTHCNDPEDGEEEKVDKTDPTLWNQIIDPQEEVESFRHLTIGPPSGLAGEKQTSR